MRRFWNWLRQKLPWKVVRIFGSLSYFNISYGVLLLVPIAHELYARSVPVMAWFGAPGDFPVTLQWLYAASLLYAGAILLYQIFCPTQVKRFSEPEDYVRAQYEIFQRSDPQHRVKIVLARPNPTDDRVTIEKIDALYRKSANEEITQVERSTAKEELDQLLSRLHGHAVQKCLMEQYQVKNLSFPLARWLSLALYVSGCGILMTLLAIRSINVFKDYREGFMVIYFNMTENELQLRAYTFLLNEFEIVESVLNRADVSTERYSPLGPDRQNREGRRYYVPRSSIPRLESILRGSYTQTQGFVPSLNVPGGNSYACKEKKLGGSDGRGCENITATDDPLR